MGQRLRIESYLVFPDYGGVLVSSLRGHSNNTLGVLIHIFAFWAVFKGFKDIIFVKI
jgi:hypothetical protein